MSMTIREKWPGSFGGRAGRGRAGGPSDAPEGRASPRLPLDEEQKFFVPFAGVARPLVRPAHPPHHVPPVVNLNNLRKFPRFEDRLVQLLRGGPAARTVRQEDVPCARLPQKAL